jgi:hypothetical protein
MNMNYCFARPLSAFKPTRAEIQSGIKIEEHGALLKMPPMLAVRQLAFEGALEADGWMPLVRLPGAGVDTLHRYRSISSFMPVVRCASMRFAEWIPRVMRGIGEANVDVDASCAARVIEWVAQYDVARAKAALLISEGTEPRAGMADDRAPWRLAAWLVDRGHCDCRGPFTQVIPFGYSWEVP